MLILAAVSRWRIWFLAGTLALAVLLQVAPALQLGGFGLFLALIVAAVVGYRKYHPATLLHRRGSSDLVSVAGPGPVLSAGAFTVLGVTMISGDVRDLIAGRDVWAWDLPSSGLYVLLLAFWWYLALGPHGVRVRADGVLDRQPLGSLFVPWAALGGPSPVTVGGNNQVLLHCVRPELVVRRGLRARTTTLTPVTDAGYVVSVINMWRGRAETADHHPGAPAGS